MSKGTELERKAENELIRDGYNVERARPDRRFIGPGRCITMAHDFFGAFDLFTLPYCGVGEWRWIQVCTDHTSHAAERRRKIEAFQMLLQGNREAPHPGHSLELWRWRGGRARKKDRLQRGWVKERLRVDRTWEVFEGGLV